MKILYVLNYQREVPPFVQMEIEYAKKHFDKVVYITRKLVNDNSDVIADENVEIVQIGHVRRIQAICSFIFQLFKCVVLRQLLKALLDKKASCKYFKQLFVELYVSEQLYRECILHAATQVKSEKFVLSSWFNGIAIAAAKLQDKQNFKAYSFAHAFEIDPHRNPYLGYMMEEYKHDHLTSISFISKVMLNQYSEYVFPIIGQKNNIVVSYLGSRKLFENHQEKSDCFTVCSCSTVTAIKRLELIVESLSYFHDTSIRWVHIGDGPDFTELKEKVDLLLNHNKTNVEIQFLGKYTNEQVQEYYANHYIDLFLNVSASEGLPISIMEAMSYSMPCLATNVGGTREIVNNYNGFIVNDNISPIEINQLILNYMHLSDKEKDNYRQNAYDTWFSRFDADKNITSYFCSMIN